ncbi:trypsin-like serine protease [Jatrophihabitans sp.]|uniref:trypsin-like serine protease n=1 Tax=Jatrophihabitans sp. TaxID=1932789 RepID=UPI002B9E9827|nr:trypsin-like serine protease [Jatrophihabitans sp.]
MARRLSTLLVCAGVALLTAGMLAGPAGAINTYNASPAPERTETGALLVLWDSDGNGVDDSFDWHCTGAMIDRDTFLTASHCIADWSADPALDHFYVSLDQDVQGELDAAAALGLSGPAEAAYFLAHGQAVEGTGVTDPNYGKSQSDPHDIGVIDFAHRAVTPADRWSFTPATLPTAGRLSALSSSQLDAAPWLVVGYGTEEALTGGGPQTHPGGGVRMKATLGFDALNPSWVRLSMIESQGYGGACYGDSGGPNFVTLNGSLLLAGVTITGDTPCYATNVAYRTDSSSARTFLAPFVQLP